MFFKEQMAACDKWWISGISRQPLFKKLSKYNLQHVRKHETKNRKHIYGSSLTLRLFFPSTIVKKYIYTARQPGLIKAFLFPSLQTYITLLNSQTFFTMLAVKPKAFTKTSFYRRLCSRIEKANFTKLH